MKFVQFQFNNFFDYSIVVEQLKSKKCKLYSNNLTATFNYRYMPTHVIEYIKALCEPLNITIRLLLFEITKDTE